MTTSSDVRDATAPTFSKPPADRPPAGPSGDDVDRRRSGSRRMFKPGWPLAAMIVPYPLWWALGTEDLALVVFSIPMTVWLLKRARVLAPRGFGSWLLFLVWVVGGVFMLHVNALGTVPDTSTTRYLTWLYRLLMYLAATVTTLYVVNMRRELSLVRVSRIISALFVTLVAGGLLGVVAPFFQFNSGLELLLPILGRLTNIQSLGALSNQPFVNKLIHPVAAQIQSVLGFTAPRPSAPFSYTNTWGLLFALTLPFFVHAWLGKTAGWRRWVAPFVLLVGVVPAVYSVDRGMWAAIVVMMLFIAVRAMVLGRPGLMVSVLAAVAVVGIVLTASPLSGIIQARFSNSGSVQGRTNLGSLAVRSVTETAPLVGFGSTRNVQGNFHSIAGGQSANCPRCSPPALGTQGQLWLVIFSQGLPGLLFFLIFFGRALFAGMRIRAPGATAATCVLIAGLVTFPTYDSLGIGLVVETVAVAVIWREAMAVKGPAVLRDTASYFGPIRRQLPLVLACTVLGLAAGAAWQVAWGIPATASETLLLSNSPRYPVEVDGPMTIDTAAQLVQARGVTTAVARATGWPASEVGSRLSVTATPNTRVLRLSVTGDPTHALAGVKAASSQLLERRALHLRHKHAQQAKILEVEAASLDTQLRLVQNTLITLNRNGVPYTSTQTLRHQRGELVTEIARVNATLSRVLGSSVSPGYRVRAATLTVNKDPRKIAWMSGLLLGFLVGAGTALRRERRGRRLKTATDVVRATDLPVIAAGALRAEEDHQVIWALGLHQVDLLVPAEGDRALTPVADRLAGSLKLRKALSAPSDSPYYEAPRVAIVASDRCRAADLEAVRRDLDRSGATVAGVVLRSRREASENRRRSGRGRWWNRGGSRVQQYPSPSRRG